MEKSHDARLLNKDLEKTLRGIGRGFGGALIFALPTLQHEGETIETAEVTFDNLPGRSRRLGAVIFMRDPRLYETDIQAESYIAP